MEYVVMVTGSVFSCIVSALGGYDGALELLVVMAMADYITGIACGIFGKSLKTKSGGLSSWTMYKGAIKKVVMFVLVWVASAVGKYLGNESVRAIVITFMCGEELLSILENVGMLGVKYPDIMEKVMEVLKRGN